MRGGLGGNRRGKARGVDGGSIGSRRTGGRVGCKVRWDVVGLYAVVSREERELRDGTYRRRNRASNRWGGRRGG